MECFIRVEPKHITCDRSEDLKAMMIGFDCCSTSPRIIFE
jgi:hypothetical protein